ERGPLTTADLEAANERPGEQDRPAGGHALLRGPLAASSRVREDGAIEARRERVVVVVSERLHVAPDQRGAARGREEVRVELAAETSRERVDDELALLSGAERGPEDLAHLTGRAAGRHGEQLDASPRRL